MIPKAKAGDSPRKGSGSAKHWNEVADSTNDFQSNRRHGAQHRPPPSTFNYHTRVHAQNNTGFDLRRGEVVEFDGYVLSKLNNDAAWFSGKTPDLSRIGWGVMLEPVKHVTGEDATQAVAPCLITGACISYVKMMAEDHEYANREGDKRVLKSAASGPVKILHVMPSEDEEEEEGTYPSERECLVQLMDEGDIVDIVEVQAESATAGDLVEPNDDGFHSGNIRRANGTTTYENAGQCWIQFVDGFDGNPDDDGQVIAVHGEYYGPFRRSGTWDKVTGEGEEATHDERPLYVGECSERVFIGKCESTIDKGSSGNVRLYHSSSLTESDIDLFCLALGASIAVGIWVIVSRVAGVWMVSPLECPEDPESEF